MTKSEKNLTTWNKVFGTKGTTSNLTFMRSLECKPRFQHSNVWFCQSSRIDADYKLEVYFQGFNESTSHGFELLVECNCQAGRIGKPCRHALSVHHAYESNWAYLFDLFSLSRDCSFSQLWAKAEETNQRLIANQYKAA
jgi:hypothetical protein